jgi:hypothetical protein
MDRELDAIYNILDYLLYNDQDLIIPFLNTYDPDHVSTHIGLALLITTGVDDKIRKDPERVNWFQYFKDRCLKDNEKNILKRLDNLL